MFIDPKEVEAWKNDLNDYNHQRKTRGFESPVIKHITFKEVKA
jgi:hypothetical protein